MNGHDWEKHEREGWAVCSLCGMVRNYERDTPCKGALPTVGVRIMAELERAAETSQAEHAAALGLATARIRELEGEREEMLAKLSALFPVVIAPPDDDTCGPEDDTCGKCGIICDVDEGCEFEPGDPCHHCAQESYSKARALVARLTTGAAGKAGA